MRKPIIAMDGYSSTGKSSISKIIAEKLGIIHLDTGALYRGITYFAVQNCSDENGEINLSKLFENLSNIHLEFKKEKSELILYLNDVDVSLEIRDQKVSENVSFIATFS